MNRLSATIVLGVLLVAAPPLFAQTAWNQINSKGDRECGAKCLYVILRGYNKGPATYKAVTKELGVASSKGYSLLELRDLARHYGLYAEAVEANKTQVERWSKTCSVILHLNKLNGKDREHYVICERIAPTNATILDASSGIPSQVSHEIFSFWSGFALIISNKPIDLSSAPRSFLAWPYVWFGLLITCCVLGLIAARRWLLPVVSARLFALCTLGLPILFGCSDNRQSPGKQIASSIEASSSVPPQSTGLWVDKQSVHAGSLRRSRTPTIMPVRIHNTEHEPVTIVDAQFTCGCLYAQFSSLTIEPESSIQCDLKFDCAEIGPRNATAILITNKNEQITIDTSWTVIASLTAEPDTIGGIELRAGETREISIKLSQLEQVDLAKCKVQFARTKEANTDFLDVDFRIEKDQLVTNFKLLENAPAGLVRGFIEVLLPEASDAEIRIPFSLYVFSDFEVLPKSVFLVRDEDKLLKAQLLISTEPTNSLEPIQVTWLGTQRRNCDFQWSFADGEGVIDVAILPEDAVGINEIEISACNGKFRKTLRVKVPGSVDP